jgi:hypothetical protein
MGKHERGIVEEAEVITSKLINRENLTKKEKSHPFISLIVKFVGIIKNNYKNIKIAKTIGNGYSTPGDLYLELNNGEEKYIELKFLEKTGKGTLANISQNALTSLGIIDAQSWQSFRDNNKHTENVVKMLNTYFLGKVDSKKLSSVYKAASELKKKIKVGKRNTEKVCKEVLSSNDSSSEERKVSNLILKIIKFDRELKIKYLNILNNSQFNKERLKKFTFLVLTGCHKQEFLEEDMRKDFSLLSDKVNSYEVYYLYKETLEIKKETDLANLFKIFENDIDIEIKSDQTSLIVYTLLKNNIRKKLLRVVYHWKNKFQGIKTPCLNIFK